MVCSFCKGHPRGGEKGHNIRSCKLFHAEQIAEMIVKGAAKQQIYRTIDGFCPGLGGTAEFADRICGLCSNIKNLQSHTVKQRERAALNLLYNA